MKRQKIQRVGNSAGILLPAEWLTRKGLKPGATVRIEITDQAIHVFPDEVEVVVEVDEKFAKQVGDFLARHSETLARLAK